MVYVPIGETIHVVGEVVKPGEYPYESGMSILKAISLAGGATKKGARKSVLIKRIRDGKEISLKARPEDTVEPGDTVEVPLSFW